MRRELGIAAALIAALLIAGGISALLGSAPNGRIVVSVGPPCTVPRHCPPGAKVAPAAPVTSLTGHKTIHAERRSHGLKFIVAPGRYTVSAGRFGSQTVTVQSNQTTRVGFQP